jgi:hypothetical protein
MKTLSICLFTILVIFEAFSYPITPRPLRKLIIESEYIVVAHVNDVIEQVAVVEASGSKKKRKDFSDLFGGAVAVLSIQEVLQGNVPDSSIEVRFSPNMICPAPPHFVKGTVVMVFLNKTKGAYTVHALSYGTKMVNEEGVELYKERIREMQAILKLPDIDEQFIQTTEWLVKCAVHPITRHEGLYELSRESDFMSYYDRTNGDPFQYALNDDQRNRLKEALLATDAFTYSELGLVDLVYSQNQEQVYQYLFNALKNVDDKSLWISAEIMKRLAFYKTTPHLDELISTFDNKMFESREDPKVIRPIIEEFMIEISKI